MGKFPKLALGALGIVLLMASGASADPVLTFQFLPSSFSSTTPSNEFFVESQLIVEVDPHATATISGTFTPPDGTSGGSFSNSGASGSQGQIYSSVSQLQSAYASAGPWSLSVVSNSVTSTYQFSPDLSGLSPSAFTTSNITPTFGINSSTNSPTTTNSLPTLQWTDSGNITDVFINLFSLDNSVNYNVDLGIGQTSWTPPSNLPPDNYIFNVQVVDGSIIIPLHTTLLSGPGISMPTTANFPFNATSSESFTVASVVPEPVISLSSASPSDSGDNQGTLTLTGGGHGDYLPASLSFSSTISGYVAVGQWNPTSDTEIFALQISDSDPDALADDLYGLAQEINGSTFADFTALASTTDPTGGVIGNLPGGFNFFVTITDPTLGSSQDYFGFDLSQFNVNSDVLTATAVAAVPEPASLGLILALPLILRRPRRAGTLSS